MTSKVHDATLQLAISHELALAHKCSEYAKSAQSTESTAGDMCCCNASIRSNPIRSDVIDKVYAYMHVRVSNKQHPNPNNSRSSAPEATGKRKRQ